MPSMGLRLTPAGRPSQPRGKVLSSSSLTIPPGLLENMSAMSAESRDRVEARVREALLELPLLELREARQLTQQQLADHLESGQAAVSKLELRTDMYVSTLRRFIEAMGGELEIVARFPDGAVRITNFSGDPEHDSAA